MATATTSMGRRRSAMGAETIVTLKDLRRSTGLSIRETWQRMIELDPKRAPRTHATVVRLEKVGSSTVRTLELYAAALDRSLTDVLQACWVTAQHGYPGASENAPRPD